MLYHSSKKNEAIKVWEKTLTTDPTNLNALQDIVLAYQQFRNDNKAKEYEDKARKLLEDANPNEKEMMFARCLVEQGYASSQDLHTQSWRGITLAEDQVKFYEEALKMAQGYIEEKEKRDWVLYTGKAYAKLCHVCFRAAQYDKCKKSMVSAIKKLDEILEMADHDHYRAEIWLTIGHTFDVGIAIDPGLRDNVKQYKIYLDDPLKSYNKALEYDPHNLWLQACIGHHHYKKNNFEAAEDELNKAINPVNTIPANEPKEIPPWNALSYRAKLYTKKAKRARANPERQKELLDHAKEDVCRALQINQTPKDLALAGTIYHLLSKCSQTTQDKVDDLRNTALDRFYEASVTEDGSAISDIHLKWAECLQDTQNLPSAIELFKIAFDNEAKENEGFCAHLSSKLLKAMLQYYRELGRPLRLLKEVAFWFVYSFKICKHEYMNKEINKHQILPKYEEEVSHVGAFMNQHRSDMKIPDDLQNNMISTLQISEPQSDTILRIDASPEHDDVHYPLTEGVDYDVYILHEGENPDITGWIKYSLVTGLECKFFALKAFYHLRDSRLGELSNESKAKAMQKSAKILIVLSHDFDGEHDLSTEMAQTLQAKNTENVIVLQREAVEVPLKLRCYRRFDFTLRIDLPDLARYILPVCSSWND
nr:uncharacterized protein LOC129255498 [Lytechinus pictus]